MVCRCSSPAEHSAREIAQRYESEASSAKTYKSKVEKLERDLAALTPDPTRFMVRAVEEVGKHLVLRVLFPGCKHAGYSGAKVLVYREQSAKSALLWREINPHFTGEDKGRQPHQAPDPIARFPASEDGWADAVKYARGIG